MKKTIKGKLTLKDVYKRQVNCQLGIGRQPFLFAYVMVVTLDVIVHNTAWITGTDYFIIINAALLFEMFFHNF